MADGQIEASIEGHMGIITLNRPEAINALSLAMIETITATLNQWAGDSEVRAVLFEGEGPRGFCSGGDVRAVRTHVLAGAFAAAEKYFASEYAMNLAISTCPKPIAVLAHGAVMGGGIGIAGHARFRFAVGDCRYAMPEAGIGFFCDVGVNAILAGAPRHRALMFMLAGLPVGVGDALTLGLADCAIAAERLAPVRAALIGAAGSADVEAALTLVLEAESIIPDAAELCARADRMEGIFAAPDSGAILARARKGSETDAEMAGFAETLATRSPTSLEIIFQAHLAARRDPAIDAVLARDLELARFTARQPDFAEGVRAVLVDKDRRPIWNPARFEDVQGEAIAAALTARE